MKRNKKKDAGILPERTLKLSGAVYRVVAAVCVLMVAILLVATVLNLPALGQIINPDNNEVSQRYIENGIEETGAVNFVAGMILDYRAFDTFGESNVLFAATICVTVMLRISRKKGDGGPSEEESGDRFYEPVNDTILQVLSVFIFPIIMVFGIYVVLNGHISPGGGFSGGAVIGAGLILYLNAFGFEKTGRFFTAKTYKVTSIAALGTYAGCKLYSFYTGANGIESVIPLGTPGNILSSGLILILNICVGMVVAGTMYTFYAMFRKGGY